jgi:hypothetical protein
MPRCRDDTRHKKWARVRSLQGPLDLVLLRPHIGVMQRPETIRNGPKWIKDCTKIRARALEFVEGKISLIDAAVALRKLAGWTHAQSDPDLSLFSLIMNDLLGLPIGSERSYWAPHALAREDLKIKAVVDKWQQPALDAARRLVDRYAWSLEARAVLRSGGHSD